MQKSTAAAVARRAGRRDHFSMDLRALVKLIPFKPAQLALYGLLDRFESMEKRMDELEARLGSLEHRL